VALPVSVQKLIKLWSALPGIGEKTARRMVFYILSQDPSWILEFASSTQQLAQSVHHCQLCGAITDKDPCEICSDPMRNRQTICVVENDEDCAAIEQSGIYRGLYHVLGGCCSPLEDKEIPEESLMRLKNRITELGATEVIMATTPRIEGDITAYTVQAALKGMPVKVSRLSYGLPVGGSIGFADRVTLHLAMEARQEMPED